MKKSYKTIFLFFIFMPLLLTAFSANAAGLVPCGQPDAPQCQLCHFLFLIRNIITFILKFLVPLGILFIIIGAIIILISRGTQIATKGRKIIRTALFAIVIALIAGIIIDTVIAFIANPSVFPFPWYAFELQCPIVKIPLSNAMTSKYDLINDINPTGVSPGDTLRYSLTYTNISEQNLTNLVIVIDYDQNQIASNSIANISNGGVDDHDKITWNAGNLNTSQSITVSYEFILTTDFANLLGQNKAQPNLFAQLIKKLLKLINRTAVAQVSPILTAYYHNMITVSSNEAEEESLNDPLQIRLPNTIFTTRTYYLIKDSDNNKLPSPGDEMRYNIKYFNPTQSNFLNVVIISDYDQNSIIIGKIDGGGVDDGDKITWNLGNLPAGQPPSKNPGCLGYNYSVKAYGTWYVGQFTTNIFYIMASGGILETHNDVY